MKKRVGMSLFIFLVSAFLFAVLTFKGSYGYVTGDIISSVSLNITVTAFFPLLTILSPENITYTTNESLLLNFSVGSEQTIWYNLDSTTNITINSSLNFNTSQGSHTLYLYANSSFGNVTAKNVTFAINSSAVEIPSGGSSGGGGSTTSGKKIVKQEDKKVIDLTIIPNEFIIDIIFGDEKEERIAIKNFGDRATLNVVLNQLENVIKFRESSFSLNKGEEKTLIFDVVGPDRGLIVGTIRFEEEGILRAEVPVIINTRSKNFLFDVKVTTPIGFENLKIGENLVVDIKILQIGSREEADVVVNYIVKDFNGNTLLEENETFLILEEKSFSKEIVTSGLEPGKYVLGLEIVYPGGFAVTSMEFDTSPQLSPLGNVNEQKLIIMVSAVVIILGAVIGVWEVLKRRKIE